MTDIVIAVLTYKRPDALLGCLTAMFQANLNNDVKIIIIDNDPDQSANSIAKKSRAHAPCPIHYYAEPKTGVAHARNRALEEAFKTHKAQWLAFIDDDEIVAPDWLDQLTTAQQKYSADAVMGDVIFDFPTDVPYAVSHSAYFKRNRPQTGTVLKAAYTGNILISRAFYDQDIRFDPTFNKTGGEDHDFFIHGNTLNLKTVYCSESKAYSPIEEDRLNVDWLMKRAYLSAYAGAKSDKKHMGLIKAMAKNIIHIGGRLALGCVMMIRSSLQQSYHQSFALRHFYMAKGRLDAFLKPNRFTDTI